MLVVLVDGELWTDESVFWQNKLQDRAKYEVVYRTSPVAIIQLTCTGKPSFYQFLQTRQDRQTGVLWDTEVPLARVPVDEPPKVKIVYGPSRCLGEEHLPADLGTNWGFTDPRDGKSMRQLRLQDVKDPPPPYAE
jgi:hypothetical protein